MKNFRNFWVLTLSVLFLLSLSACKRASPSDTSNSSTPAEPAPSAAERTQTDILYAVFYADEVKEYPIEYTGAQKTAEELAQSLSELTGLRIRRWLQGWTTGSRRRSSSSLTMIPSAGS